jgi:hypothetical protein
MLRDQPKIGIGIWALQSVPYAPRLGPELDSALIEFELRTQGRQGALDLVNGPSHEAPHSLRQRKPDDKPKLTGTNLKLDECLGGDKRPL